MSNTQRLLILLLSALFISACATSKHSNYWQGMDLYSKGDLTGARGKFQDSCEKNNNIDACVMEAYVQALKDRSEAGAASLRKICDEKNHAKACFYTALSYSWRFNQPLEVQYFKKSCALDGELGCEIAALDLYENNELAAALKLLQHLSAEHALFASPLRGWVERELGDIPAATRSFKTSCWRMFKGCTELGVLEAAKGDHDASMRSFKTACVNDDELGCALSNPSGTKNIALTFLHSGKRQDAIKAFASGCAKKDGLSCLYLGSNSKNSKEAKSYFEKSCELNIGRGCFLVGTFLQREGSMREADDFYSKACSLGDGAGCMTFAATTLKPDAIMRPKYKEACDKKYNEGCFSLANSFYKEKDYTSTQPIVDKLCSDGFLKACSLKAFFFAEKKQWGNAISTLESPCNDGYEYDCLKLADFYRSHQELFKAKQVWKKSCDNNNLQACRELASIYYMGGNFSGAKEMFEKVCNARDGNACAWAAESERKMGNTDSAKKFDQRACKEDNYSSCDALTEQK